MISASQDKRGRPKFCAQVRLAMKDKPTIDWVAGVLARETRRHGLGKVYELRSAPMYRVVLYNIEGICSFVEQILPFMRTKRESASMVLAFCRSRAKREYGGGYLPSEMGSYMRVKKANATGIQGAQS